MPIQRLPLSLLFAKGSTILFYLPYPISTACHREQYMVPTIPLHILFLRSLTQRPRPFRVTSEKEELTAPQFHVAFFANPAFIVPGCPPQPAASSYRILLKDRR